MKGRPAKQKKVQARGGREQRHGKGWLQRSRSPTIAIFTLSRAANPPAFSYASAVLAMAWAVCSLAIMACSEERECAIRSELEEQDLSEERKISLVYNLLSTSSKTFRKTWELDKMLEPGSCLALSYSLCGRAKIYILPFEQCFQWAGQKQQPVSYK